MIFISNFLQFQALFCPHNSSTPPPCLIFLCCNDVRVRVLYLIMAVQETTLQGSSCFYYSLVKYVGFVKPEEFRISFKLVWWWKKSWTWVNFISATGCCVQEGIHSMAAFNPSSSFSRITSRGRAGHRRAFGGKAVHGQAKMSSGLRAYSAVIGADQHKKKAVLCNKRSVFCNNIAARIEARKAKVSATGAHGSTTCKITLPTRLPGQCASCNTATSSQLVSKRLRGGAAGSNCIEPDSRINKSRGIGPSSSSANYTTNAIACYVGPRASQAGLHQAAASISNSAPTHHRNAATDVSSSSAGASLGVCGGYKITGSPPKSSKLFYLSKVT